LKKLNSGIYLDLPLLLQGKIIPDFMQESFKSHILFSDAYKFAIPKY
jgi:hypothetical protein